MRSSFIHRDQMIALLYYGFLNIYGQNKPYRLYETLVRKRLFWLKWVVNQVSMISHSLDVTFSHFETKKVHFSHFCWSKSFSLYKPLIVKWVFWLKWAVNLVCTISGSRDMKFSHFSAKVAILAISVGPRGINHIKR